MFAALDFIFFAYIAAPDSHYVVYVTNEGRSYYHNHVTGDTRWDPPPNWPPVMIQAAVQPPAITAVVCAQCGSDVDAMKRFCGECGAPVFIVGGKKPGPDRAFDDSMSMYSMRSRVRQETAIETPVVLASVDVDAPRMIGPPGLVLANGLPDMRSPENRQWYEQRGIYPEVRTCSILPGIFPFFSLPPSFF